MNSSINITYSFEVARPAIMRKEAYAMYELKHWNLYGIEMKRTQKQNDNYIITKMYFAFFFATNICVSNAYKMFTMSFTLHSLLPSS